MLLKSLARLALLALVVCRPVGLAAADSRTTAPQRPERGHADISMLWLPGRAAAMDAVVDGWPAPGGPPPLFGVGATFGNERMRISVMGHQASWGARLGGRAQDWDLRLASLAMEERYAFSTLLLTSGAQFTFGQLEGLVEDGSDMTRYEGQALGGALVAGVRWPNNTPLGFGFRTGWLWQAFQGEWRGKQAAALGTRSPDLGGAFLQGQIELGF